jgi:hypothetical protein
MKTGYAYNSKMGIEGGLINKTSESFAEVSPPPALRSGSMALSIRLAKSKFLAVSLYPNHISKFAIAP